MKKILKKIEMMLLIVGLIGFISIEKTNVYATEMNKVTMYPDVSGLSNSQMGNPDTRTGDYVYKNKLETSSQVFNKKPRDFPSHFYLYSTYSQVVSMPIQTHWSAFNYRTSGDVYEYEATFENSTIKTFENEATVKLATRFQSTTALEFGILDFGKAGSSSTVEINSSVELKVKNSTTLQWGTSTTERYKKVYSEDGYYMFETRGMFVATVITVFKTNLKMVDYKQHNSGIFKYHTWSYDIANYQSVEEYVVYSYIPNSAYTGIFKYKWNSLQSYFEYVDTKIDDVLIF